MKTLLKYRFWLVVILVIHIIISTNLKSGDRSGSEGHSGKGSVENSSIEEEDKKAISEILDDDFKQFIAKQENGGSGKIKIKLTGKTQDYEEEQETEKNTIESKCDEGFYEGVGFTHSVFQERTITEIAKGYAADRAGIKLGDVVIGFFNHSEPHIFVEGVDVKGSAGTGLDLFVKRNGKIIKLSMIREKICYKKTDMP